MTSLTLSGSSLVLKNNALGVDSGCCCGSTCCNADGSCKIGGPGEECIPTGAPGDDGCYCDDRCYTICFDCCGPDAATCCTDKPILDSLWHDIDGPQKMLVALLEVNLASYAVDQNEAWHAAMQSGTVIDGYYHTEQFSRLSLILCLQDMESGVTPWVAQQDHRNRVVTAASQVRLAAMQ